MEKFKAFLRSAGAEVLVPTNQWEMVRFRTAEGTSIVYRNKKGDVTFTGQAEQAWIAYKQQAPWNAKPTSSAGKPARRRKSSPVVRTIRERDGDLCFFCWKEVHAGPGESTEHLVPKVHGGPHHISNLFLAHKQCNSDAGHLSAPEKIAIHVRGAFALHAPDVLRLLDQQGEEDERTGETVQVEDGTDRVAIGDAADSQAGPHVRSGEGSSGDNAEPASGDGHLVRADGEEGHLHPE